MPKRKLSPETVAEMRRQARSGMTFREIAARAGVAMMTAFAAVRGDTWQHVNATEPPVLSPSQHSRRRVLTEEVVGAMRREYRETGDTLLEIAERFDVSVSTAAGAIYGHTWRHVPVAPAGRRQDARYTESLRVEVTPEQKRTIQDAAASAHGQSRTTSIWIRDTLMAAAENELLL